MQIRLLIASLFFLTFPVFAVPPKPAIFITSPANGQPVYYDPPDNVSGFYDDLNGTVRISGIFRDVSDELIQLNSVAISINGSEVPADFSFLTSRTVDGILYRSGIFSQDVALDFSYLWPMRKFVAEIVNTKNLVVLDRHQISLYDLRAEDDATPYESINTEIYGMHSQLTDRGLGHRKNNDGIFNLEKGFKELLPYPSLANFNDKLKSDALGISRYDNDSDILRACIKLSKVSEPNFQDPDEFEAYGEALDRAKSQYRTYKRAKRGCNAAANPAAVLACKGIVETLFCIKSKPKTNDFNLCVDQIEGEAKDLSIDDVSYVGLNFEEADSGQRGLINSHITADNLEGKVNLYLRSLSVRWRHPLCLTGPNEEVDDSYIATKPWLNEWATCKKIPVRNSSATTVRDDNPSLYKIIQDRDTVERHLVELQSAGEFAFLDPSMNASKGTCGEEFINEEAKEVAGSFRTAFQSEFEQAWFYNSPATMEAQVLTKILWPYHLGETPQPKHDIFAAVDSFATAPDSGLVTYWLNSVVSDHPKTLARQKNYWFYVPGRLPFFSEAGEDHLGRPFDISYSVSTALLNRILNMRVATPQGLPLKYKPTWAELEAQGVNIPAGQNPEDVAVLDKATLVKFDPAFLLMPNKRLIIEINPKFDPIVYMPPDYTAETEIPNVGAPTIYGIEGLEVTFKEKDREVDGETIPGKTWLKLVGGFFDKDFRFSIGSEREQFFLDPHLTTDLWGFNITEIALPGCRLGFTGPGGPTLCEDRLERRVTSLIKNAFRDIFIEMVSRVPVPKLFNANAEVSNRKDSFLSDANRRQDGQNISFFGVYK